MSKDKWNKRFAEAGYFYGKEPNLFIREKADMLPEKA